MLLKNGEGVFEDAIPDPSAGCSTSKGASTVTIPVRSAGNRDGDRAHSSPNAESNAALMRIPIE